MTEYEITLIDSQSVVETLEREGNDIKMALTDTLTILEEIGSDEFVTRAADIAFIRSNIY